MSKDAGGGRILERVGVFFHLVMIQHTLLKEGIVPADLHVLRVEVLVLTHQYLVQSALTAKVLCLHCWFLDIHVLIRADVVIIIVDHFDSGVSEPL